MFLHGFASILRVLDIQGKVSRLSGPPTFSTVLSTAWLRHRREKCELSARYERRNDADACPPHTDCFDDPHFSKGTYSGICESAGNKKLTMRGSSLLVNKRLKACSAEDHLAFRSQPNPYLLKSGSAWRGLDSCRTSRRFQLTWIVSCFRANQHSAWLSHDNRREAVCQRSTSAIRTRWVGSAAMQDIQEAKGKPFLTLVQYKKRANNLVSGERSAVRLYGHRRSSWPC